MLFQEIKSLVSVLDISMRWVEEPADHVSNNFSVLASDFF